MLTEEERLHRNIRARRYDLKKKHLRQLEKLKARDGGLTTDSFLALMQKQLAERAALNAEELAMKQKVLEARQRRLAPTEVQKRR